MRKPHWIATGLLIAIVGLVVATLWLQKARHYDYGFSFSQKYANELGLNWRKAYKATLEQLPFKHVRLMSYWDLLEGKSGKFDFADLDWQFRQAQQHGVNVSLAIGLRQPRWPECHQPEWVNGLSVAEQQQRLLNYLATVVRRYRGNATLGSWQLENEALNRYFGRCHSYNRQLLQTEFDLVKRLDSTHPIIMNLSDEHGLPLRGPVPDEYGFSIYRTFYNQVIYRGYINYPTPLIYHRLRAGVTWLLHRKPIIVHELQAEPWGPVATVRMPTIEQNKSMSPARLRESIRFGQSLGIRDIYFWGAEFWYWRLIKFNDPSYWNIIKQTINQ